MPMASAEILTVVQSYARSFKLSNTGPVIGSIYQDRLTAVAGEIGRQAPPHISMCSCRHQAVGNAISKRRCFKTRCSRPSFPHRAS